MDVLEDLFSNRILGAIIVVIVVPIILVGYILLVEAILRLAPRRWAQGLRPWLWIAPALTFIGVFLVYPTIATIIRSFMNRRGDQFIGLENFQWFFSRADTLIALRNNALWVVLLPLFFAYSGLRTQIGLLDSASHWSTCGLVIALAVAGKFGGSTLAARVTGIPWREASAIGILMNTRGLMELIVLNIGLDLGVITPTLFAMLVLMAIALDGHKPLPGGY